MRGEEDDLLLQRRILPGDHGDQILRGHLPPRHPPPQAHLRPRLFQHPQTFRHVFARIEPWQIRRHIEERLLGFLAMGTGRFQEHHGRGPQVKRIHPSCARGIVEQDDPPGHRLPFEAAAIPAIHQRPLNSLGRQGRRPHQVGPDTKQFEPLPCVFEPESLVNRHQHRKLVPIEFYYP